MGLILERSGMAEDLLDTIGQLFGPLRGGLAYAVIFVGALLAATTGVVAASVIAMGLISLPIMLRYGYDRRLATGVIAASGTLAQIMPPSLVLIVLADQLGRSVGDMYAGALRARPDAGRPVSSLYVLLRDAVQARTRAGPAARGAHPARLQRCCVRVLVALMPPLVLIFLVLGTIFLGIATPTEGGAMGAAGALVLALLRRRLTLAAADAGDGLDREADLLRDLHPDRLDRVQPGVPRRGRRSVGRAPADGLPGGAIGFLIVVNLLVFLLAFFLDFFEIAFIVVPLLAPVADKLGIDPIWFGVLLGINMQTSFMHPPFGFALFYLRSVAPKASAPPTSTGARCRSWSSRF